MKRKLEIKQEKLQKEVEELRIDTDAPKIDKTNQLEFRKKELVHMLKKQYVKFRRKFQKMSVKLRIVEGCFEPARQKDGLESKINKVEEAS